MKCYGWQLFVKLLFIIYHSYIIGISSFLLKSLSTFIDQIYIYMKHPGAYNNEIHLLFSWMLKRDICGCALWYIITLVISKCYTCLEPLLLILELWLSGILWCAMLIIFHCDKLTKSKEAKVSSFTLKISWALAVTTACGQCSCWVEAFGHLGCGACHASTLQTNRNHLSLHMGFFPPLDDVCLKAFVNFFLWKILFLSLSYSLRVH